MAKLSLLKSPIPWLCLSVYLGIAVQTSGLYLFGILGGLFYFCSPVSFQVSDRTSRILAIAVCLACAWLVFPFVDLLRLFFPLTTDDLIPKNLGFVSKFSSMIFVSSIFLAIFSAIKVKTKMDSKEVFGIFLRFLFIFACLFFVYVCIQHANGFSIVKENLQLGLNDRMPNGRYRVSGFYGHTLSVSSVALCFLGFASAIAYFADELLSGIDKFAAWALFLLSIAFSFLAGGRIPLLIAVTYGLAFVFVFLFRRRNLSKGKYVVFALLGIAGLATAFTLGYFDRFKEIFDGFSSRGFAGIGDRTIFWQVYLQIFKDAPLFGQGAQHLEAFVREAYYQKMGWTELVKKYNAHNLYLEILASVGILGFFVIGSCGFIGIKNMFILSRDKNYSTILLKSIIIGLALNLLHSLTQNVFFDSNVVAVYLAIFWIWFWTMKIEEASK